MQRIVSAFLVALVVSYVLSVEVAYTDDISLTLINASTDQEISQLVNEAIINFGETGQELNIRADISIPVVNVQFELDGVHFRTEKRAPYAMAGDEAGNYLPWTPEVGNHTLQVTAYDATGEEINRVVHFVVLDPGDLSPSQFNQERDLISLHYDHCADPDDGHATVADRTMTLHYGITPHVVSGTYGWQMKDSQKNIEYQPGSEMVSTAAWGNDWLNAHDDWAGSVEKTAEAWSATLEQGGHIWISEAGQSDFSADVLRLLHETYEPETMQPKIHLVQHGQWNEQYTTPKNLAYVKKYTDYIKIDTGNRGDNGTAGLMVTHNNNPSVVEAFIQKAKQSKYKQMWQAAFDYLDPLIDQGWPSGAKLDFSDSVELLYILGIDKKAVANCSDFANIFLNEPSESSFIVSFAALSGASHQSPGTTELQWKTQNAKSVRIEPSVGVNLPASGSIHIKPKQTTTYRLIATNGSRTDEKALVVIVNGSKDTDTDGDGMPDEWEISVGLDPLKNDSNADKDKDGVTNLEEYIAGTDPSDAKSIPDENGDGVQFQLEYDKNGNLTSTLQQTKENNQ